MAGGEGVLIREDRLLPPCASGGGPLTHKGLGFCRGCVVRVAGGELTGFDGVLNDNGQDGAMW